jgi:hypothetical protein
MTPQPSIAESVYSQEDWLLLSDAYERSAAMLGRSPRTHPHAERLAREILRLFNSGKREVQLITSLAVINEQTINSDTEQGRHRHSADIRSRYRQQTTTSYVRGRTKH